MNQIPSDLLDAFYVGKRHALPFCVNDCVVVMSGEHSGRRGAVISPESIDSDPVFLVEFGEDGSSALLAASILRLIDAEASGDNV